MVGYGDHWELVRIDPEGDSRVVLRWQQYGYNDTGLIAVDERGVYLPIDSIEGIVRIAHDAPEARGFGDPPR
jgi:hypothetical protein